MLENTSLTRSIEIAVGHVSEKSFIGSLIALQDTHLDAAVVPVESANLSPVADPTPVSAVVERGAPIAAMQTASLPAKSWTVTAC